MTALQYFQSMQQLHYRATIVQLCTHMEISSMMQSSSYNGNLYHAIKLVQSSTEKPKLTASFNTASMAQLHGLQGHNVPQKKLVIAAGKKPWNCM
jgi:hypothetical protein